jgi:hypothetical protein
MRGASFLSKSGLKIVQGLSRNQNQAAYRQGPPGTQWALKAWPRATAKVGGIRNSRSR